MANTINWGQAAVENTIDYGQGATDNTISWGKSQTLSPSGETNITGAGGTPAFTNTLSTTFDGTDDAVVIGTASLGITNSISVSAWVKIPTTNTGGGGANIQVIIAEDPTSSGKRNWNLFWRGGGIDSFYFVVHNTNLSSAAAQSVGVTPNSGQWIHILATYDGTANTNGIKLYIDGVLNAQGTASSTGINSFTSSEPNIGRLTGQNQWNFEGNIDEVAVWNSELSASDANAIGSTIPTDLTSYNPIGWWRMGDGSTYPTINDAAGSNDGTMTNMSAANFVTDVPT